MDISDVDPNYEYEAPQFFDFNGQLDEEEQPDAWFENKPDDEGGRPILKLFESPDQLGDEINDEGQAEEERPKQEVLCSTKETKDVVKEDEPVTIKESKVEEQKVKEEEVPDIVENEGNEAKQTTPEKLNVEEATLQPNKVAAEETMAQSGVTEEGKSEVEFSNDSLDETKEQESENSTEVTELTSKLEDNNDDQVAKVSKPRNIVTSWAEWGSTKPKNCQADENNNNETKMVTRAQKRSHALNVSASSGIPNKKQKEVKDAEQQARKRPRSMSNNPERKSPCPTVAVTPQCLKRQKITRPTMIKLKTTEEMEMDCIAKLRRQTKQHIKANKNIMKKAITATTYHPVRNVTELTKPQEFSFQTDKRVKPHPMTTRTDDTEKEFLNGLRKHPPSPTWKNKAVTVPKPFHFSGSNAKRKLTAMDGDEKPTDSYESMALQVYKFQKTTPPRFRTRKAGENSVEHSDKACEKPKVTYPVTPHFATSSRARPVSAEVLSKEEQEIRDAEAMKNYKFKAKPFDPRIIECDGLFGVKKHKEPKHVTTAVPFSFGSDERLDARKEKKAETQVEEQTPSFKAMPQPKFDKVFRPQLKHERTAPKPFSFEEKDKERWQKKDTKIQDVYKQEEKLREFKASLLPPDSPDTLPEVSSKSCTSFKPFALNTENRGAVKAEKWIQKVQTELQEERKKIEFRAKPNKVTHEAAFVPQRSQRPLTEVSEFALNTDRRAERREEIDTLKKEREQIDEQLRKEREEKRLQEEREAIALLRKNLVHKAKPIHRFKEVVVKPSDRPLTAPESPAWSVLKQRRLDR